MSISGEVHCMACGRYLAAVKGEGDNALRLVPITGATRTQVQHRDGMLYCLRCGGRAFVEYEVEKATLALTSRNAA